MSDHLTVILAHSAWNDQQLIGKELEGDGISIVASVSNAVDLNDQARMYEVDCVLFSPTIPGMNPALVQELLVGIDSSIASVGLIPAGTTYAADYQRTGMKGYVTTPLDPVQVQRLPALVREAVRLAQEERQASTFTATTHQEAAAIVLDRGGWQQSTIAVYTGKGGDGKSTTAVNLAVALSVVGQRPTLLIDADMSRANAHIFLDIDIEEQPRNLFALYERVIGEGNRTGRYLVQAQTLQANIREYHPRMHFLPGIPKMHMAGLPEFMEDTDRTMDIFGELLATARGFYEFRIVDVGPDYNLPIHWAALEQADTVLLIVTPQKTSLHDVKNLLPTLEQAFGNLSKFKLVLNQFDADLFGIRPKDVIKFLDGKVPVIGTIPWAPEETRLALNEGQPLAGAKHLTPVGKAYVDLASTFYPVLEIAGAKRKMARKNKKSGGLLNMFLAEA